MEVIGKATHQSICINCLGDIQLIEWGGAPGEWTHVENSEHGGGMQGIYCKGSPRAEPEHDNIERID